MDRKMKVSVLMTLYNGMEYLQEQLDSIYNQTRKPDEVVICDDGSKDGSIEMIRNYIQEKGLEDSWVLHQNEKNLGYAENFYQGMFRTHGEIVFFSDQDDIWYEDKIEKCTRFMADNPKLALLCTEFEPYICSEDAPTIPNQFMQYMNGNKTLEHLELNNKTIFIGSEGCVMCVRRSFFEQTIPYHFEGWAHDEFVWKLALAQDGCFYYHEPLIKRRMHSNNVSKKKMRDLAGRIGFLERLQTSHQKMLEYGRAIGMDEQKQQLIVRNMESVDLRIGLMKHKKYFNTLKLLMKYANNYPSKRSILVELYMAVKG